MRKVRRSSFFPFLSNYQNRIKGNYSFFYYPRADSTVEEKTAVYLGNMKLQRSNIRKK